MTETQTNSICIMSQDQIGDLRESIGKLSGMLTALTTNSQDFGGKLERLDEKLTSDRLNMEKQFATQRDWVELKIDNKVKPIAESTQFLKNKYWVFVGVILTVNVLIALTGLFLKYFWK